MKLILLSFLCLFSTFSMANTTDEMCASSKNEGKTLVSVTPVKTYIDYSNVIVRLEVSKYECKLGNAISAKIEDSLAKLTVTSQHSLESTSLRPILLNKFFEGDDLIVTVAFNKKFLSSSNVFSLNLGQSLKRDLGISFELVLSANSSNQFSTEVSKATPVLTIRGVAKIALAFSTGYGTGIVLF